MKKVSPEVEAFARIKVVGVGGSGTNVVNHMVNSKVKGVEFIVVNTDAQDLHKALSSERIHIGKNLTRGLGTGMNPELGKRAAEETREEVQEVLKGADMVFVACGFGGGTGTGASPIVAKIAREAGALTVGVVTKPFYFEGTQRMQLALQGLDELRREVDAIIIIPNDKLLSIVEKETTVKNAFAICDEVLKNAVEGISDLITTTGIINVDFADIRAILKSAGSALMGIGIASGESRATTAAKSAINSPLLDVTITGAKGVLFAVAGGEDMTMLEIQEAAKVITEAIDPNAKVIFGAIRDEKLAKGEVKVTVIASGFPEDAATARALFQGNVPENLSESPAQSSTNEAEPQRGRIHNTVDLTKQPKETPPVQKKPEPEPPQEKKAPVDDDDDWGVVPAFLRRKK